MVKVKYAANVKAGEIVGLSFGAEIGLQWALVESVEDLGDKVAITVKMQKRFTNRPVITKKVKKEKRVNTQNFEEFMKWCKMYKLDTY